MMSTRRLLLVVCLVAGATALSAQTTKTTPKKQPTPAPAATSITPSTAATEEATATAEQNQGVDEAYTAPVTADTDKDLTNPRALKLSLNDAITMSMSQNIGVAIQRYDYRESGELLREAWGPFDWFVTGDLEHQSNQTPTASAFQASGRRTTFANLGLSQLLPTGGTYNVTVDNSRTVTTGGGTLFSPAYGSSASLSLDQPLARNFGIDITRRNIYTARNTLGINQEAFRLVLMNTAVSVDQAYLNLIYARRFVDVQKEALFLARDQARITQIRINVGASAPLDILQPRVQIATTEEALIAAVASVRDAEDQLRALLNVPPADWDRPIIPTDTVNYTPVSINVQDSVTRAFELRPEMREQLFSTENAKIQYRFARNQVLPKLDAIASYGAAGLAGTLIDPTTGATVRSNHWPSAFADVLRQKFPSWTIGATVGIPILNIGARAEARRSQLELERNRALEDQERQNIAIDVRKTARDIDTNAKEIIATRTAREAAEKNVDAERKRYENGMTTIFQVLQIQQQLSDARAREIQALVQYNQSIANYHRSVGDLLDTLNITVEHEDVQEPNILKCFDKYSFLNFAPHDSDAPKEQTK